MTRHLLHVGFPKAGSTFLQRWFEAHPRLAYAEGGIAGSRDVYSLVRDSVTDGPEPKYYVTSSESFSAPNPYAGQMSIDYDLLRGRDAIADQRRACELLGRLFPGALVLVVTRGFRSMILSSYSQYVRSGGRDDGARFVEALRSGNEMIDYWHYDAFLDMYAQTFGASNVVVLPYELLRDDVDAFIGTLADRLGIDAVAAPRQRVNEALSPVELLWYPRLTRWVRRMPSHRLRTLYLRAALQNRLRAPIALLQRLRPGAPFTLNDIPDEMIAAFRGRSESLRANPLYAPYAAEYLHD